MAFKKIKRIEAELAQEQPRQQIDHTIETDEPQYEQDLPPMPTPKRRVEPTQEPINEDEESALMDWHLSRFLSMYNKLRGE